MLSIDRIGFPMPVSDFTSLQRQGKRDKTGQHETHAYSSQTCDRTDGWTDRRTSCLYRGTESIVIRSEYTLLLLLSYS